jgi:hypothetical protein
MTTEYTNVVQLGSRLVNELKVFIETNNLVGKSDATYLIESFESFKELLADPIVSKELDNYKLTIQNPIEKYGIADEVITMIEGGMNISSIVDHFKLRGLPIESKHVNTFSKGYQDADILTKIEKSNSSVFDTEIQLQMIFDTLTKKLADLEYADDDRLAKARVVKEQLEIEYIRELRMLSKDAQSLMEALMNLEQTKKFNSIVLEIINKECGATVFNKVVAELRKQKVMFGFGL